jgi:hypothetical protein
MNAYWGSEGTDPRIVTSALDGGGWSAPRLGRFIARESPWYSLDRRPGDPQSRSGRDGEKKFPAPAGTRTPSL